MTVRAKPLTLVSGYLGTGKTTLINHVLASGALGRAAVVVNDFGSVNIDAALIRSTGADTIELTNGCICCQITDDVQRTMTALAARDDLDHVVCEVSGIGNPAQLGAWRTYPGFRPGGVVVCVDAAVTLKRLRDEFVGDIVRAQIGAADLLVVTKADSVSDTQLARVREACVEIAGEVTGEVPFESVRHVPIEVVRGGDWLPALRALDGFSLGRMDGPAGAEADAIASDHAGDHASITVELREPVDVERLTQILRAHTHDLMRAKGVVRAANGPRIFVELAGGVVSSRPEPKGSAGPAGASGPAEPTSPASTAPGSGSCDAEPARTTAGSSLVLIAAGPCAQDALRRATQDLGPPHEG